jgi:peptidyl-tRNA hydrolase, PTH1 family
VFNKGLTLKYLIVGLGNIGLDYVHTRHNIGFDVVEAVASSLDASFKNDKKAWLAEAKYKGRALFLAKPTTFMNLSGEAVRYWLTSLKIPRENLLIVSDDLALPFGSLRLKPSGGAAGHNGLTSIIECLQTDQFARLRFGIGSDFPKGRQSDYVLGKWSSEEAAHLPEKIIMASDIVKSFSTIGIQPTMNLFNNK